MRFTDEVHRLEHLLVKFSGSTEAAKFVSHHSVPLTRNGVPGVDYAWSKPSINALKGAGEVFVAQYASPDGTKNLTPSRAHDLLAAGIKIVLVYEYGAQDMRRGKSGGEWDAQNAETLAKACGVDGIPVFFACDYDAPPGDQALIDAYLDGTASVLGDDRGRNIYGGYWPLSRAKANGKAKRLWGTPAWSGSEWATSGLAPDIMQGAMVNIGGVQCDLDAGLSSDFGQWPRPTGPTFNWGWWTTDGNESLAAVSRRLTRAGAPGMSPAHILRATCTKTGGHWDAQMFGWLNEVLGDPGEPSHTPIAAGSKLWVLQPS